jgi:hypothetical protein
VIRVVVTVLVAVALLAVATPALKEARTDTTVERIGTEADRLERVAAGLAADSVAVGDPALAARTSAVVTAPSGLTAARLDRLALANATRAAASGPTPGRTVVLVYRLRGEPRRAVLVPAPTDGVGIVVDGGPVELRPGGESRLAFRLVDDPDDGPTIRISRTG